MSNVKPATGLCVSCKYNPHCIYEAGSSGPILQCEEFEPEQAARRAPVQDYDSSAVAEDTRSYAGLCSNCDHRKTCIHVRPEGVWRCEEYA